MEDKNKKEKPVERLEEGNYDIDPPVEFVEHDASRPPTTPDVKDREEELEKFRKGELGAEGFRYNDDGPPRRGSRKMDIDTKADPK